MSEITKYDPSDPRCPKCNGSLLGLEIGRTHFVYDGVRFNLFPVRCTCGAATYYSTLSEEKIEPDDEDITPHVRDN